MDRIRNADQETGYSTWQYLDALVNLAIDNLKEQGLYPLGINLKTGNALVAMLITGMPMYEAIKILQLPEVQELNRFNVYDQGQAINEKIKELREVTGITEVNIEIADSELTELLKGPDPEKIVFEAGLKRRLEVQIGALEIYKKAYLIGEDINKLAVGLKVLRSFPTDMMSIIAAKQKLEDIFGTITHDHVSKPELPIDHTSFNYKVSNSFAFVAPKLVENVPHIGGAIYAFNQMMKTLEAAVPIYHDNYIKLAARGAQMFDYYSDGKLDIAGVLKELSYYFVASTMYPDLRNPKIYDPAKEVKQYGPIVYANALSKHLTAARAADMKLVKKGAKIENRLLESTVISNFRGNSSARLSGMNKLAFDDIKQLQEDFEQLENFIYDEKTGTYEFDPKRTDKTLTNLIVNYAHMFEGLQFSSSSLASKIPYKYLKEKDTEYKSLVVSAIGKTSTFADNFLLNVAMTNLNAIKKLEFNKIKPEVNPEGVEKFGDKYAGMLAETDNLGTTNWFYDLTFTTSNPLEYFRTEYVQKRTEDQPGYISFNLYKLMQTQEAGQDELGRPLFKAYYKRIARKQPQVMITSIDASKKAGSKLFYKIKTAPISETFGFHYKALVSRDPAATEQKLKPNLDVGEIVYLYNENDTARVTAKVVRITAKKENELTVHLENVKPQYNYTVEEVIVADDEISFAADFSDDPVKSKYPPRLKEFLDYESRISLPTLDSKFYVNGLTKYYRVTDSVLGALNTFRPRPFTDSEYDWPAQEAAKWFEGSPAGARKDTDLGNNQTREEYETKLRGMQDQVIAKGNLIHAYMRYISATDSEREKIKEEVAQYEKDGGLRPGAFDWILHKGFYKKIFAKMGINKYDGVPEDVRDIVHPEFKVHSKLLGWAGTVDMFVYHADGSVSMKEMKSG